MSELIEGQLELDLERGVIYFHAAKTGQTFLRICRLPKFDPEVVKVLGLQVELAMIDIAHMHGVSYNPSPKEE